MNGNMIANWVYDPNTVFDGDLHDVRAMVTDRAWDVPAAEDRIADFAVVTVHRNDNGEYTVVAWFEDVESAQLAYDTDKGFMDFCEEDPYYADEQDILVVSVDLIRF